MMEETGVGSNGTEPPGGESEGIKGQLFSTWTEDDEWSNDGKFKGPGGEHIKNFGQQVMSVRIPEGFVRKSTWYARAHGRLQM